MQSNEFQVTAMTCGHCEMAVREEAQKISGVESVEVSHRTDALSVTSSRSVEEGAVIAAVQALGYRAVPAV